MWNGVLWTGLRVAMWIAHVGGKYRHGLLEKSLNFGSICFANMGGLGGCRNCFQHHLWGFHDVD